MLEIWILIFSLVVCFISVIIAVIRKHNKLAFINCLIMVGGFIMSMLSDVSVHLALSQMVVLWVLALIWSLNKDVAWKFERSVPPAKRKDEE